MQCVLRTGAAKSQEPQHTGARCGDPLVVRTIVVRYMMPTAAVCWMMLLQGSSLADMSAALSSAPNAPTDSSFCLKGPHKQVSPFAPRG